MDQALCTSTRHKGTIGAINVNQRGRCRLQRAGPTSNCYHHNVPLLEHFQHLLNVPAHLAPHDLVVGLSGDDQHLRVMGVAYNASAGRQPVAEGVSRTELGGGELQHTPKRTCSDTAVRSRNELGWEADCNRDTPTGFKAAATSSSSVSSPPPGPSASGVAAVVGVDSENPPDSTMYTALKAPPGLATSDPWAHSWVHTLLWGKHVHANIHRRCCHGMEEDPCLGAAEQCKRSLERPQCTRT